MIRLDRTTFEQRMPELEALFQMSFGQPLPAGYLRWRFLDNPVGQVLSLVAEDGPKIIANYCVSPCRLTVGGRVVESALSMMTMTHPEYGGRGLFTKLARQLYGEMAEGGYHSVWGFPNENSHVGFVSKLGWRDIYEVPTLSVEVQRLKAVGVAGDRDDAFDGDYGFLGGCRDGVAVDKDAAWLKWRYAANPLHEYANHVVRAGSAIQAFAVTKRYQDALDLVDLQAPEPEAARQVLSMVAAEAVRVGARRIHTWMPLWSPLHTVLERLGFTNGAPVTYLGGLLLQEPSQGHEFHDFRGWYVQMGDSDVY